MARNPDSPRQVRYNMRTHTGEQEPSRFEWTFFTLNRMAEIKRIQEGIFIHLGESSNPMFSVCGELTTLDYGIVDKRDSLHGRLINFRSEAGRINDSREIYSPRFYKDKRLRAFTDVEFDRYIDTLKITSGIPI